MGTVTKYLRELQESMDTAHDDIGEIQQEIADVRNHLKQLEDEIAETE